MMICFLAFPKKDWTFIEAYIYTMKKYSVLKFSDDNFSYIFRCEEDDEDWLFDFNNILDGKIVYCTDKDNMKIFYTT